MPRFPPFLTPALLARLAPLTLQPRRWASGSLAGLHRSPRRGFSVEYAEHREYAPGDDLRHLDWRAFARSDKFYLKQYVDETNFLCYLAIDVSGSMCYHGARAPYSKLACAQTAAAAIAYLAMEHKNGVAGATFTDRVEHCTPLGGGQSHWEALAPLWDSPAVPRPGNVVTSLGEMARRFVRRGIVVVLSDCFHEIDQLARACEQLAHVGHELVLLQVVDPDELDFPFWESLLLSGLEAEPEQEVDGAALRAGYQEEFQRHAQELKLLCRRMKIDHRIVRTDVSLPDTLADWLAERLRRGGFA